MTEEEKFQIISEYDDDLLFGEDEDVEEISAPKCEVSFSEFTLWFEAMKKRLEITKMQKALFCRKLCAVLKNDQSEDMKKLWCLCLSEHSDFLFEKQGDVNDIDYIEYRNFNFAILMNDIQNYMRRLENETALTAEFTRLAENITFQNEPLSEINADALASAMGSVYGIGGENYLDNMRKICGEISRSPELSKIAPNVLYALFMRYRKKLTDSEDFSPNFKSVLRKINYIIDVDNGKNQAVYEEHLDVYENLCECFKNCDKHLCDAGFACMSNLCENEALPWENCPDFERPIEIELRRKYFSCFPNGLEDNPVFAADDIDIDVGDIAAFEIFYDEKLPPKLRIIDAAEKFLNENSEAAEQYLTLIENGETDKCIKIIHDIIERSEINPAFIKPEMVNLTNAVIMEEVCKNISGRIKAELLEFLPKFKKEC
ncbi:MAG: hypothetical protein NC395_06115 [Prevotella sp.]|nr:hypothetical protein [Prevotella sp.]